MIVIVTTVVVLVIGILSLGIAMYGGFISTAIVEGIQGDQEAKHLAEQKYYLLGMIGVIVLTARLLNVPIFFWMIQSLVPYLPGAMCGYGVVNAGMPFSIIALILKIFIPFAYGMWLVFEFANRREPMLPLMRKLARSFLLILLPLVLIDSAVDVLLVVSLQPVYAPCCSSAYDVDPPFSPSAMFGPDLGFLIIAITVILSFSLIAFQWFEQKFSHLPFINLVLCGVVALLYVITIHDTYSPLVLGLATHHCPYCLFQEFPDTAVFTGLFWIGIASAGWRIILESVWKRNGLPSENISTLVTILLKLSSLAILFSMVSMLSHLSLVL
jgi:hypothetical protein